MKLTGYIKTITNNGTATTCTLEGDQVYVDGSAEKQNRHNLFWDGSGVQSEKVEKEYIVDDGLENFVIAAYTSNRKVEVDVVGAGSARKKGENSGTSHYKIQSIKLL